MHHLPKLLLFLLLLQRKLYNTPTAPKAPIIQQFSQHTSHWNVLWMFTQFNLLILETLIIMKIFLQHWAQLLWHYIIFVHTSHRSQSSHWKSLDASCSHNDQNPPPSQELRAETCSVYRIVSCPTIFQYPKNSNVRYLKEGIQTLLSRLLSEPWVAVAFIRLQQKQTQQTSQQREPRPTRTIPIRYGVWSSEQKPGPDQVVF